MKTLTLLINQSEIVKLRTSCQLLGIEVISEKTEIGLLGIEYVVNLKIERLFQAFNLGVHMEKANEKVLQQRVSELQTELNKAAKCYI